MLRLKRDRHPEEQAPIAPPDPLRRAPGGAPERGRGATFNPGNRFRREGREAYDDGWPATPDPDTADDVPAPFPTIVTVQPRGRSSRATIRPTFRSRSRSIRTRAASTAASTATRGRRTPTSTCRPGLDFETKLFAKPNAPELLRAELGRPGYRCDPIALGTNTDPYQPIEREWKITRGILEVLVEHEHPFTIVTKSALVERDLDLIAPMAAKNMARVYLSVTTLDKTLARTLEPRAAAPQRRLQAIGTLARCRRARRRARRAGHSAVERPRPRVDPRRRGGARRAPRRLDHAAAAARGRAAVPRLARRALSRCAPSM